MMIHRPVLFLPHLTHTANTQFPKAAISNSFTIDSSEHTHTHTYLTDDNIHVFLMIEGILWKTEDSKLFLPITLQLSQTVSDLEPYYLRESAEEKPIYWQFLL